MGVLLWVIVIGFVAGVIARLVMPGPNTPKGFVVTTI
ncbi:MAG: GlsB/YeaQ/YmgE family stress response membrane protein, partial [Pseudolabrys sp.]